MSNFAIAVALGKHYNSNPHGFCSHVTAAFVSKWKGIMKKYTLFLLLAVVTVGICDFAVGQITVVEIRMDNGDSTIKVVNDIRGVTKNYRIIMSDHHHPATGPDDKLVKTFKSWKYGAFICYNSNQYSGYEFCKSTDPVKDFKPTSLDVREWIETISNAGMNYALLTVRHTSEFLLWESVTSDCDSTAATGKDLVKEYVDHCRGNNIAPGFYYCLWGGGKYRPHPNARAIILAQLHELATNYGKIPYFWLDMKSWGPADLSAQEIYDSLKNVNPETIVMFNQHIQDGSVIRYFPTDILNGEMCSPPAEGHDPYRTVNDKKYYLPFEYEPCSQMRSGGQFNLGGWDYQHASWFTYGQGKSFAASRSFDAEFLYRRIKQAYDHGSDGVMMSCAPDHTGLFRQADIEQFNRLRRMLDDPSFAPPMPLTYGAKATASGIWPDPGYGPELAFDDKNSTRWGGAPGTKDGWIAADLGEPKEFSKIKISEGWDRTRKFELQIKKDGRWHTIHKGTTIGFDYSATFHPVKARHIRLNIIEATDVPTIWECQLFNPIKSTSEN